MTNVFLLIATTGRVVSLESTLNSLASCRRPRNLERVVVVENGHQRGVEQAVARLSDKLPMQYLHHPRANKSSALNAALEHLPDGLAVFTDDDIECGPDFLVAYADACERVRGGVFFGGVFQPHYMESEPDAWVRPYLPVSVVGLDYSKMHTIDDVPPFMGCNWAAFTHDLKNAGGFDPRYGPGSMPSAVGQETEMQYRLLAGGCKRMFLPKAVVHHHVPARSTTPQFALLRRRRLGVRDAILKRGECYLLGVVARRIIYHGMRYIAKIILRRSTESRFKSRYELAFAIGSLVGIWVRFRTGEALQSKVLVL